MKKPIRVLHVVGRMNIGGTETMIMNILREINHENIQFDFMVHDNQVHDYEEEIKKQGCKIYRVPRFNGFNIISYIKSWNDFFRANSQYKIVHGHIGSSAALYLWIANKYGCYTIAHSHSTKSKIRNIKDLSYRCFSFPVRYIAKYFMACGTKAGIDRYGEKVFNSSKFKVLNNAIDTNKFIYNEEIRESKRKELNINDKFVIGHVGRFVYEKNHKFLIEVFKEIYSKNKNTVLLLVGDGELKLQIKKDVEKYGLQDCVIFTGVRSDVNEIMQAMDVFLFPSHFEGLPLTVIEAQASGIKCILSDVITKEVDVTKNVEYISLNKTAEEWCNEVIKYEYGYERNNMYKKICNNGYDIKQTTKWLEKFYISR